MGNVYRSVKLGAAALAAIIVACLLIASPAHAAKATNEGHKHIVVTQSAGQIDVSWGATTGVRYYEVKTSSMPDMSEDVATYKVSKSSTSTSVPPTRYAVAGTGNYTFVRVYAIKKNGKVGVSPYRQVRMESAAPAVSTGVTVATYNVRTAETEVPGHPWSSRLGAVASQIQASGAAVVGLQEAGAPGKKFSIVITQDATGKHQHKDFYWQYEQVRDAVGGNYKLVDDQEYSAQRGSKEGTRILYDASKVSVLDKGDWSLGGVNGKIRYAAWAKFLDLSTQKTFYFFNVHLTANDDDKKKSDAALSKVRVKQITGTIARVRAASATGSQVILAGDFNSNIYSAPNNAVDRALIRAHFYDAYATAPGANTNEFYVTFNNFAKSKKSASRTDYILTYGSQPGSFSYKNWIVQSGTKGSDHNMQSASVPIY